MKKTENKDLNRLSKEDFKSKIKTPVSILLDNIRSMNNVGSCFRTCDAFLIEKIYLTGITASPPHREIHKTALGATESVDWEYKKNPEDILQKLKKNNWKIVLIEQTNQSIELNEFNPKKSQKYCFIFGNEVFGISKNILPYGDFSIEIPQFGTKHSLNIAVSFGIVIWDFFVKSISK